MGRRPKPWSEPEGTTPRARAAAQNETSMSASGASVFPVGRRGAAVFEKMKLPRIIGMLLVGILIGPYALGLLDPTILSISGDLRKLALMLILLRAGLSLDLGDLKRVGRPAVLMAFVPATFEVLAILLTAPLGAIGMDATADRLLQK